MRKRQWLLLASICLLSVRALAEPGLEEILREVVARDDEAKQRLLRLEYCQEIRTDQLDGSGNTKKTDEIRLVVKPGEGLLLVPNSSAGTVSVQKLSSQQLREARAAQQVSDFLAMRNLVPRYAIQLEGEDVWNGQRAYVLAFSPKPDAPCHSRADRVLNALHGRVWARKKDCSVLHVEANLTRPVPIAWIFASVDQLDVWYEASSPSPDLGVLPANGWVEYRVGTWFGSNHAKQQVVMRNYRRGDLTAGAAP
ncbi:hypothetical protein MAMC_00704 [Methylacidimicrobium cyclopophantes]|uniref:Uncharacterized protein n=1 Tax=Methylacidimicrobium cyclopophantes TaxID=1041766 RepID=A0A5E6M8D3_9BACT|nr:hypothetical protein [Methylacidimicrobium cyclopophantes]VVM05623.1 hypothetical protein MAMC_00704 [Methylacidimicrobium cyclopophantes]